MTASAPRLCGFLLPLHPLLPLPLSLSLRNLAATLEIPMQLYRGGGRGHPWSNLQTMQPPAPKSFH